MFWALGAAYIGGFPKLGVPFGGPYNKDYSILGSVLGSPYSRKLPIVEVRGQCRVSTFGPIWRVCQLHYMLVPVRQRVDLWLS